MDIPLGKSVQQPKGFAPAILAAVPRILGRSSANIDTDAFKGLDRWTAYEFVWFDQRGVGHADVLNIEIDSQSKNLVESKSLKLFLNSCYYQYFESPKAVETVLSKYIEAIVEGPTKIQLLSTEQAKAELQIVPTFGASIDGKSPAGNVDLKLESNENVHQCLYTDLFRSLCPVTGQPDWATIVIEYIGSKLDQRSLLGYLRSYAEHSGFHEACVESIFQDIRTFEGIEEVAVCAKFLRRGGIDICPFRTSTDDFAEPKGRSIRQ